MAGERPEAGKIDPETLALRAPPRRVVRFKRRLMIGIAAVGIAGIFGVTWLALQRPILRFGKQAQELYSTDRKSTAEELAGLPKDYSQIKPETPALGPPLPGDLGPPILERQKQLGLAPGVPESEVDRDAEAASFPGSACLLRQPLALGGSLRWPTVRQPGSRRPSAIMQRSMRARCLNPTRTVSASIPSATRTTSSTSWTS